MKKIPPILFPTGDDGASAGRVLVVGASGPTGGAVVRALSGRGAIVRGIARSDVGEQQARKAGADEVVRADLRHPDDLRTAMAGVESAFYFSPRAVPDEAALGRAFIKAAEESGVSRIVVISMINSHAPIPNHQESLQVEEALARTSLSSVILQPAMFMQTLPHLDRISELGWVGRPYPIDVPLAWVDFNDVAEIAATSLLTSSMDNGTFELCSGGMLTIAEIGGLMSEALGSTIESREITLEEWAAVRGEDFSSPYRRECYAEMFDYFSKYGFKGGNSLVANMLLGRSPVTWPEYLVRTKQAR
ncbi:unannotated protein [freshwater metagenome]|uniref:Unannotated protein n=1 Tax=freshwater metagenome TaxID=449393 RepID=A0A6J7GIA8_9ZZZZ|nr:NAD(P)H-binding protein [Actinomycetota bacterium]